MLFIETPVFTRLVTEMLSDDDYAMLQQELARHPESGRMIRGGAGIRKVRWAVPGSGKRGGIRIVYYWRSAENQIYLLYLFAKNMQADLSASQVKRLGDLAKALK